MLRAEAYAVHESMVASTPELYQPETLKRIRGGADVMAVIREMASGFKLCFIGAPLMLQRLLR